MIFIDDQSIFLIMSTNMKPKRPRGRPAKVLGEHNDTRRRLLHAGVEVLTEAGYSSIGIETILKREGIPKGSFYHYFDSKEAFGKAVIESYNQFFKKKLAKHLQSDEHKPLSGFHAFVADAMSGIEKYKFRRGCLIGNLGQELSTLPTSFGDQLTDVFTQWSYLLAEYLKAEQDKGNVDSSIDCTYHSKLFWIGWEGAILHTKLQKDVEPIRMFVDFYLSGLKA